MSSTDPENYLELNKLQEELEQYTKSLESAEESWLELSESLEEIEDSLEQSGRLGAIKNHFLQDFHLHQSLKFFVSIEI